MCSLPSCLSPPRIARSQVPFRATVIDLANFRRFTFPAYNAAMPQTVDEPGLTQPGPGSEPGGPSNGFLDEPRMAPRVDGWPIIGVAWHMRVNPLPFMLAAVEKHNGAVLLRLAQFRATLLREPEHIKRVFVDNADNYTKQTRGYAKAKIVLGQGLVTSEGELWQRQRRIATPAFSRQRVAAFAGVMTATTEQMLSQWRENPFPMTPVMVLSPSTFSAK